MTLDRLDRMEILIVALLFTCIVVNLPSYSFKHTSTSTPYLFDSAFAVNRLIMDPNSNTVPEHSSLVVCIPRRQLSEKLCFVLIP